MIFRGVRMEHHISDINIKSFRGIKNLELKNVNQINILTGDNNNGKIRILLIFVSGVRCSEEMDREECHLI